MDFCTVILAVIVNRLKVIAFTHKSTPLKDLGRFFIGDDQRLERLTSLKSKAGIEEIFYLATCNRVEFVFTNTGPLDNDFLKVFFTNLDAAWAKEEIDFAIEHAERY